jgi:UDP-2,3-diacylglucosamine pyrophosphatase LpxH
VRTLIISDLHLGSRGGVDVLRRPAALQALLGGLDGVERLVLLGDVLELRAAPFHEALAAAREPLRAIGRALGEREVVLLVGNHDHAVLAPWFAQRALLEQPAPLGVQTLVDGRQTGSPALTHLAELLSPARVSVAHPGFWVREDVWAHHGHYLDVHITLPTMERLGAGAMGRLLAKKGRAPGRAEDYEARLAPLYAWVDTATASTQDGFLGGHVTVDAWNTLRGGPGLRGWRRARALALARTFPLVIGALNAAGLGPLSSAITSADIERAGLQAMAEVVARLGVRAPHVLFGHTHRAGPLAGDAPAGWEIPGGARLYNCGSWVYETHFMGADARESPYWPGRAVLVEDTGPPRLLSLLGEVPTPTLA